MQAKKNGIGADSSKWLKKGSQKEIPQQYKISIAIPGTLVRVHAFIIPDTPYSGYLLLKEWEWGRPWAELM